MTTFQFRFEPSPREDPHRGTIHLWLEEPVVADDDPVVAVVTASDPGLVRRLIEQANRPDAMPTLYAQTSQVFTLPGRPPPDVLVAARAALEQWDRSYDVEDITDEFRERLDALREAVAGQPYNHEVETDVT